jgi:hypothetical protein
MHTGQLWDTKLQCWGLPNCCEYSVCSYAFVVDVFGLCGLFRNENKSSLAHVLIYRSAVCEGDV